MVATAPPYVITWQQFPDHWPLPDDSLGDLAQPALAAALTCTNYGICATVNDKIVVKAPDWAYIPRITVPQEEVLRSYTPQLQGDFPAVVLEFLSETEGTEYSIKSTYPLGKFFYYEQILTVPNYGIFNPKTGTLELYRQENHTPPYKLQTPNEQGRFWIPELDLFLGPWQGERENIQGYWLRWWDAAGNLLLWDTERVALAEQRAEQERQRAERLTAQLRSLGIEPEASR